MLEDSQQISDSIFRAIESGNLDEVNKILEKDLSALEQKNSNGLTPIFLAIQLGNLEIVNAIIENIEKDSSVLKQKDSIGMTPIFRAIELGNLEIVKAFMAKNSRVLTHRYSQYRYSKEMTPIFLAIESKSLMKMPEVQKKIVEAIIEKDVLVLTHEDSSGMTPIFRAIVSGNLEIVEMLIKKNRLVLEQKYLFGMTPIFFAIRSQSLKKMPEVQKKIVKAIIEKDPSVLTQKDSSGMTPIFCAASMSVRSLGHDNEDKTSEVLQTILDHQCPRNINKGGQEDFKELFSKKMLLKGIYSGEEVGFMFELLEKAFDKITPENTFNKIYQDLFENVDKNQPINLKNDEKMYIFQSNLEKHSSFFIFHVNKANELTSISYCDGNKIDEERKIKDSATHINGVTTFHLKTPIGYNKDFAKNFINENSQDNDHLWFYDKFINRKIIHQGKYIDFSEITHSIPTKAQKKGNCTFKSSTLLARFILEKIDPTMKFGFDEVSQKPTGAGYDEYKEFKDGLTKNALDFIMKIKEKISSKLDSFSDYLREEIEDVMTMVETNNEKKLSKDDQSRKEFHQEMNHLLFRAHRNKDEAPKPSCFPFFTSWFSSDKTPQL